MKIIKNKKLNRGVLLHSSGQIEKGSLNKKIIFFFKYVHILVGKFICIMLLNAPKCIKKYLLLLALVYEHLRASSRWIGTAVKQQQEMYLASNQAQEPCALKQASLNGQDREGCEEDLCL